MTDSVYGRHCKGHQAQARFITRTTFFPGKDTASWWPSKRILVAIQTQHKATSTRCGEHLSHPQKHASKIQGLIWLVGTHCSVWNAPKPAAVGGPHHVRGAVHASQKMLGLMTAQCELHAPERWLVMQPAVLHPRHILQTAGTINSFLKRSNMQLPQTSTSSICPQVVLDERTIRL